MRQVTYARRVKAYDNASKLRPKRITSGISLNLRRNLDAPDEGEKTSKVSGQSVPLGGDDLRTYGYGYEENRTERAELLSYESSCAYLREITSELAQVQDKRREIMEVGFARKRKLNRLQGRTDELDHELQYASKMASQFWCRELNARILAKLSMEIRFMIYRYLLEGEGRLVIPIGDLGNCPLAKPGRFCFELDFYVHPGFLEPSALLETMQIFYEIVEFELETVKDLELILTRDAHFRYPVFVPADHMRKLTIHITQDLLWRILLAEEDESLKSADLPDGPLFKPLRLIKKKHNFRMIIIMHHLPWTHERLKTWFFQSVEDLRAAGIIVEVLVDNEYDFALAQVLRTYTDSIKAINGYMAVYTMRLPIKT